MGAFGIKFRLFRFPVTIDLSFLLVGFLLFGMSAPSAGMAVEIVFWLGISILIHELGHAFAGRFFGRDSEIRLHFLGGLTQWDAASGKKPTNAQSVLISLAGPVAGFIFVGLVYLCVQAFDYFPHYFLQYHADFLHTAPAADAGALPFIPNHNVIFWLYVINIGFGIANLVPLFPLDGGQVIYYLLRMNKRLDASQISSLISLVLGGALMVVAIYFREIWLAFILMWILAMNWQRMQMNRDVELAPDMERIKALIKQGDKEAALRAIMQFLEEVHSEPMRQWAYQTASQLLMEIDDDVLIAEFGERFPSFQGHSPVIQYRLLRQTQGLEAAGRYLLAQYNAVQDPILTRTYLNHLVEQGDQDSAVKELWKFRYQDWFLRVGSQLQLQLFKAGKFAASIRAGEMLMKEAPDASVAYNLACGHARLGNVQAGLAQLRNALKLGFNDKQQFLQDPDLEPLRGSDGFAGLVAE